MVFSLIEKHYCLENFQTFWDAFKNQSFYLAVCFGEFFFCARNKRNLFFQPGGKEQIKLSTVVNFCGKNNWFAFHNQVLLFYRHWPFWFLILFLHTSHTNCTWSLDGKSIRECVLTSGWEVGGSYKLPLCPLFFFKLWCIIISA